MPPLTRRHLIATGGAGVAAIALAACGEEDDPRDEGRDGELLAAALAGETALAAAYDGLAAGAPEVASTRDAFLAAQRRRVDELRSLEAAPADGSETAADAPEDGPAAVTTAANAAIAAYREGAGLLSTEEQRGLAIRFLAQVAAEVATINRLFDRPAVPAAFVTGGDTEPFVPSPNPDAEAEPAAARSDGEDGQ
jgi:hypothetical protein